MLRLLKCTSLAQILKHTQRIAFYSSGRSRAPRAADASCSAPVHTEVHSCSTTKQLRTRTITGAWRFACYLAQPWGTQEGAAPYSTRTSGPAMRARVAAGCRPACTGTLRHPGRRPRPACTCHSRLPAGPPGWRLRCTGGIQTRRGPSAGHRMQQQQKTLSLVSKNGKNTVHGERRQTRHGAAPRRSMRQWQPRPPATSA